MAQTSRYALADAFAASKLGMPLLDWIEAKRPDTSWKDLGDALAKETDGAISVDGSTLYRWYADHGAGAA